MAEACAGWLIHQQRGQQDEGDGEQDLRDLAPEQRAQAAARLVQGAFAQVVQLEPVVQLQAAVDRLPGGFEVVEFHRGVHAFLCVRSEFVADAYA